MKIGKLIGRVLIGKDDRDIEDIKPETKAVIAESAAEIEIENNSEIEITDLQTLDTLESENLDDTDTSEVAETVSAANPNIEIDIPEIKSETLESETESEVIESKMTTQTKEQANQLIRQKLLNESDVKTESPVSTPVEENFIGPVEELKPATEASAITVGLFESKEFAESKKQVEKEVDDLIKNHFQDENQKANPIKFAKPSTLKDEE